jgi:hypothetical protein
MKGSNKYVTKLALKYRSALCDPSVTKATVSAFSKSTPPYTEEAKTTSVILAINGLISENKRDSLEFYGPADVRSNTDITKLSVKD